MDRYLYKAKRLDNEEWVTGSLITCEDGTCKIATSLLESKANEPILVCAYDVDRDTICQCTGLKDKNGKLIWENDICDRKEEYPEIVKYNNGDWTLDYSYSKGKESGYCYCNLGFYALERNCVEVVGNIFDNAELLESEGQYD